MLVWGRSAYFGAVALVGGRLAADNVRELEMGGGIEKDLVNGEFLLIFVWSTFIKHLKLLVMNSQLNAKILELWTISRTALAGQPSVPSRYDRMIYVKKALIEYSPELTTHVGVGKHLWFAIEDAIS